MNNALCICHCDKTKEFISSQQEKIAYYVFLMYLPFNIGKGLLKKLFLLHLVDIGAYFTLYLRAELSSFS